MILRNVIFLTSLHCLIRLYTVIQADLTVDRRVQRQSDAKKTQMIAQP